MSPRLLLNHFIFLLLSSFVVPPNLITALPSAILTPLPAGLFRCPRRPSSPFCITTGTAIPRIRHFLSVCRIRSTSTLPILSGSFPPYRPNNRPRPLPQRTGRKIHKKKQDRTRRLTGSRKASQPICDSAIRCIAANNRHPVPLCGTRELSPLLTVLIDRLVLGLVRFSVLCSW